MTAQDLVNQGYYGYKGWGDAAANADFNATHGAGKGGPTSNQQNNTTNQTSSNQDFGNVLNNAQQIRNFNVQSNQPAIGALQSFGSDLQSRYSDLLNSIKGQGSTNVNNQTTTTNNALALRGITPDSQLYQQTMTNALQPVNIANQGVLANANLSENQSLGNVQSQIAGLQTGDPNAALAAASGLYQTQGNLGLGQAQLGLQQNQQAFNQRYITIPNIGVYDSQSKQFVGAGGLSGIQMVGGIPMVNQ